MVSKHSAAIKARMRKFGESYYTARTRYLQEMGMLGLVAAAAAPPPPPRQRPRSASDRPRTSRYARHRGTPSGPTDAR